MRVSRIVLVLLLVAIGCGAPEPEAPVEADSPATDLEAAATGLLPFPFTAEQIRDEWIVGFRLEMQRVMADAETHERWTVLSADEQGVEIEYATLDETGGVHGEPKIGRSTWIELRDHATFPEAKAEREEAVRETPLGRLEGWLYTVQEEGGAVSEFFFARDLPGAPVSMSTTRGDEVLVSLAQLGRHRPES